MRYNRLSEYRRPSRPVIVAFQRFGPYHKARLAASTKTMDVIGLELGSVDDYAWAADQDTADTLLLTLLPGENADKASPSRLLTRLRQVFSDISPAAVAVPGWSQRSAIAVLYACIERSIPTIVMSDSSRDDTVRHLLVEYVKSRIVSSAYSAAFVAGTRHHDYAVRLGMPDDQIVLGYDVVDNRHFANAATRFSHDQPIDPPQQTPYFLASARFLERKNLVNLLHAFNIYKNLAGNMAWRLVLLGDGDLRPLLEAHRARFGLEQSVLMPGFKQYHELPAWYCAASCFVHASTTDQWGLVVNEAMAAGLPVLVSDRCGCAPDLVREGVNGFTFDPSNPEALASAMVHMAHGDLNLTALGGASREIIGNWGLGRFSSGLNKAVKIALHVGPKKPNSIDQALLRALLYR